MISYRTGDRELTAAAFLALAERVWPGDYDLGRTEAALARTLNITARDGSELVGCLRILSDGCFFGAITELLVLPEYRRRGIGSALLRLAREHAPTLLYFGAQPGWNPFTNEMDAGGACNPMKFPRRNAARDRARLKSSSLSQRKRIGAPKASSRTELAFGIEKKL